MKKLFLSLMAVAMCCVSAYAQENTEKKDTVPAEAVMLQSAANLVKYGYAHDEALPLIQAAQIYQDFGLGTLETTKTTEGGTEDQGEKKSTIEYSVDKLLADATTMADGNEHLLALISEVKNSGTRGATQNYAVHYDSVNAHTTDTYNVRFRGGEVACVIVNGDGDTDLDLYIYDDNGNFITSDTDSTDTCVCTWTPRYTGNFTIKIKNLGRVYNRYAMAIN